MSFKATLFFGGQERTILNANQMYQRFADVNGRPTSEPIGTPLEFSIESTRNDSFFYQNMFSPTMKCEGEIVFYRRDGLSTLFKIEFANAQIIDLSEHFNAVGNQPLSMNIVIGWGIIKMRNIVYEQTWNPNNPFENAAAPTVINNEEPEVIDCYYTDLEGNEDTELEIGTEVFLVVKTENMVGETTDFDLSNNKKDFEYNGKILEDDMLIDFTITSDLQKVKLKIITPQKEPVEIEK